MSMQTPESGQEAESQGPTSQQSLPQGPPAQQQGMAGSTAITSMDTGMLAPMHVKEQDSNVVLLQGQHQLPAPPQQQQQHQQQQQQQPQQQQHFVLTELPGRMVVRVPGLYPGQMALHLPQAQHGLPRLQVQQQPDTMETTHTPGGYAESADPDDDLEETDSDGGRGGRRLGHGASRANRKPHLQGRFSGRLATKEDERRLAEECRLLAPLLGGVGKRGDRSRLTLAKIVRGIATGEVRRHLEAREAAHKAATQQLSELQGASSSAHVRDLQQQIAALQRELESKTMDGSSGQVQVAPQGLVDVQIMHPNSQSMANFQPASSSLNMSAPPQQHASGGQAVPVEAHLAALQEDLQAQEQAMKAAEQGHAQAKAQVQQLMDQISKHQQDASGAAHQAEANAQLHAQAHSRAALKVQELQAHIQQLQQQAAQPRYMTVGPPGASALPVMPVPSDMPAGQPYVIAGPVGAQLGGFQLLQQAVGGHQGHQGVRFLLSDAGGNLQPLTFNAGGPQFLTMGPADALAALQAQGMFRPALQPVHALATPPQGQAVLPPHQPPPSQQ